MREGYKDSVLGQIPTEWKCFALGELGQTYSGLSGKTKDDFGKGKPFISYMNIFTNSKLKNTFTEFVQIGDEESQSMVKYGDIFFTTSSETPHEVGMSSVLLDDIDEVYLNSFCFGFRLSDFNTLLPDYARYVLRGTGARKTISILAQGSTRFNLSKITLLKRLFLAIPPLPEQQKIAEILSTVDDKIDVIDQQISETQALKKGLMQRLLTKGIGHTDFKDSPLGEIPKSWEVKLLEDCAKRGSGHTPDKKMEGYYDGGIKWVSLGDSNKLDNRYIDKTKIEISEEGLKNSSAVLHPKGTVLLSRDAGVGKSAVMKVDMAVSQHFITWECDETFNNWFLYFNLQVLKPTFERVAIGSTIKTIGLGFFKKMKIVVPPIKEQIQIANILNLVEDKIVILKEKKSHYKELKKGLMQQLLTGKTRVSV